jgi:homoserine dehydrogenase
MVAFEAAVAGGIPIIKALREGLTANRIEWIAGIINGTTNFILSEMRDKGLAFETCWPRRSAWATRKPIPRSTSRASTPPTRPRSCRRSRSASRCVRQGLRRRHHEAAERRHPLRRAARLPHQAAGPHAPRMHDGKVQGIELRVHPTLIPQAPDRQRRGRDERRAGQGRRGRPHHVLRQGRGAEPTASAVIADLVDVARMLTSAIPTTGCRTWPSRPSRWPTLPILPIEEVETAYYLRLRVADEPGVLADITRILADARISIDADAAARARKRASTRPTSSCSRTARSRSRSNAAIARIEALPTVLSKATASASKS